MRRNTGGPFGCVIVKDGKVIARASNSVTRQCDPTAHAEVVAIRKACRKLKTFQLDDCELYCSCEPCPMCLSAIYWARPSKVYYAATRTDAAFAGFDDDLIYHEMLRDPAERKIPFERMIETDALALLAKWKEKPDKINY
jgi:tRNA(Arg) A34 adenosine deaminase TadA